MINNAKYMVDTLLPDAPSYRQGIRVMRSDTEVGSINIRMDNYKIVQGTTPQMDIYGLIGDELPFSLGDVFCLDDGYTGCVWKHMTFMEFNAMAKSRNATTI